MALEHLVILLTKIIWASAASSTLVDKTKICVYVYIFIYIQDLKNIKNVKGCRDGMPKVCKQGRNDIIVKVSLQSLIPASFSH